MWPCCPSPRGCSIWQSSWQSLRVCRQCSMPKSLPKRGSRSGQCFSTRAAGPKCKAQRRWRGPRTGASRKKGSEPSSRKLAMRFSPWVSLSAMVLRSPCSCRLRNLTRCGALPLRLCLPLPRRHRYRTFHTSHTWKNRWQCWYQPKMMHSFFQAGVTMYL